MNRNLLSFSSKSEIFFNLNVGIMDQCNPLKSLPSSLKKKNVRIMNQRNTKNTWCNLMQIRSNLRQICGFKMVKIKAEHAFPINLQNVLCATNANFFVVLISYPFTCDVNLFGTDYQQFRRTLVNHITGTVLPSSIKKKTHNSQNSVYHWK